MTSLDPAAVEARLRRGIAAFNAGDFDAVAAEIAPDMSMMRPIGQPDIRGAEAFREWMKPDAFTGMVIDVLDVEISGDRALVRQRTTAKGAGSGIELEVIAWTVWILDADGLVSRIESYVDRDEDRARASFAAR